RADEAKVADNRNCTIGRGRSDRLDAIADVAQQQISRPVGTVYEHIQGRGRAAEVVHDRVPAPHEIHRRTWSCAVEAMFEDIEGQRVLLRDVEAPFEQVVSEG